nr:retrovirus-related Pol polyprotein from transposon TNT 1-94 [Tanacetum cinerariifolium]
MIYSGSIMKLLFTLLHSLSTQLESYFTRSTSSQPSGLAQMATKGLTATCFKTVAFCLQGRLYCRGKDNRVNILKSIDEGPYILGTFRETLAESTEGTPQFGLERPRVYSDLNSNERDRYNADIRATNILLQGLPKDIYTLINHYTDAKDIWDNVKMLLEGSELIKEDRETQLETLAESTEGTPQFGPKRPRVYSDLNSKERDRYNADIRATNILLQGLPKDIYTLINHYTDAKDIWDNVKMLLEGSELTKEDRESQLYDDFEHFRQHKEESINDYYVRFSKLINDMRNIKMTMPKLQLNSKFVNYMLPEWGYGEAQNRVGNVNQGQARPGQAKTVKGYNCN